MNDRVQEFYDEEPYEELCDICNEPLEECSCHDCGMREDGTCDLAGSEWCDWSCKTPENLRRQRARIANMKRVTK